MAPPNTLFIPTTADLHANAIYMQIMDFFTDTLGVIDFTGPDGRGGNFVQRPRIGQLSAGFERADVAGTLTTSATSTTTTNTNEQMVRVDRTLFHEYFPVTMTRAHLITPEMYSAEIGRQVGILAGQRMLVDLYRILIASADNLSGDHDHEPYVDDVNASNQVDLSPTQIQSGKFLLADHMDKLDVAVTNSKAWNDLTQTLLTTTNQFQVPAVIGDLIRAGMFRDVMGMTWIVDDQIPTTAGPTTSSPTKQNTLLLRSKFRNPAGEAPVEMRLVRPLTIHSQHVLGGQSRREQLQAELAYFLGVRGSKWDDASSGANPTDANLALATNWDDAFDDERQHGAILVVTN